MGDTIWWIRHERFAGVSKLKKFAFWGNLFFFRVPVVMGRRAMVGTGKDGLVGGNFGLVG